ncbi:hypothetical protein HAX54_022490 [Datura stramonium]|uniref:Uncharacterized protein n=1 Tax=Datura stramonium TaxID=4076 RepID=A0ABS8UXE0_DATST|nr:hypothetical protein [Datura stramonium]
MLSMGLTAYVARQVLLASHDVHKLTEARRVNYREAEEVFYDLDFTVLVRTEGVLDEIEPSFVDRKPR